MRRFLPFLLLLFLGSCAFIEQLQKKAKPDREIIRVRTTAYTSNEPGHRTTLNAIDGRLKTGKINSAAADWSRFPVGTKFKVLKTGKVYVVDDYGSAMVWNDTVDLYMKSNRRMRRWGVRHVDIEVLEWGDRQKSYDILKHRQRYRYISKMVRKLKKQLQDEEA